MSWAPLVDVVMCTNRVSPYLGAAIRSLQAQTYPRWRLIVADDGSGRGTDIEQAVAGIADVVVVHLPAGGPATARNAAIASGTGEVVSFLDDDDVWPEDRLARAVETLARSRDALGAYGDGIEIDDQGRRRGSWSSPPATSRQYLAGSGALPRITTLSFRRWAIERFGAFTDGMYFAEDTELTLRMVRHGELVSTGAVMVEYRRHGANATLVDWRVQWRGGRDAITLNMRAARADNCPVEERLLRRNLAGFAEFTASNGLSSALTHVRAGRVWRGVADLWAAFWISPPGLVRAARSRTSSRAGIRRTEG
ncbi:glycosyltransferase family 2 protein [Microbacterium lacus]|uniref:glycosyltransferase family 2 protein n=1 Tax=Microbacterium lacus TaxID=415217 RepID=UPI00384F67F6